MSDNGVKKIIFSLYRGDLDNHTSVPEYKRSQLDKYKSFIESKQKSYAKAVKADYELFEPSSTDYDEVQFEKLLMFEKLSEHYDEILYLDFDVVPIRKKNIFKAFDLNTICAFNVVCKLEPQIIRWRNQADNWHGMDMYSKAQQKRAMLLLDDMGGSETCLNTGVVAMNKKAVETVNLSAQLNDIKEIYEEALKDNLYPQEMTRHWRFNNEVVLSYLIEKNDLPYTNIGMPWNFIIDNTVPHSDAAYFLHCVNKKFDLIFG